MRILQSCTLNAKGISLSPDLCFYEIKDMVTQRYCVFDQNSKDVEQMIQQNRMSLIRGDPPFYILLESRGGKLKAGPKLVCSGHPRWSGSTLFLCWFYSLWSLTFRGSGRWAGYVLPSGYSLSLFALLVGELVRTWPPLWR